MSGYDRRLGPCSEYCAVVDECEARGGVIQELRAENERLREALAREIRINYESAARKALGETE